MNKRRSNVEIVADMLRVAAGGKTEIMYSANLSHSQLNKYLRFLQDRGFLERRNGSGGRGLFRPTPRGQALLKSIEEVRELLEFKDWNGVEG